MKLEAPFTIMVSSDANDTDEPLRHHRNRLRCLGHNLLNIRRCRRLAFPNSKCVLGNCSGEEVFIVIGRSWDDHIDICMGTVPLDKLIPIVSGDLP